MAITHNLSDIADNLSCFDPVAGEVDGTTIGRSWLVWKIFEELTAQWTNFAKITNASPTPVFLQGDVGSNLQTEPAKNRNGNNDTIRFYDKNDPGLLLATPQTIVYEWRVASSGATGVNSIDMRMLFHRSGSALYTPMATSTFVTGTTPGANISIYAPSMAGTTTTMNNIPKVIFWKSSNIYVMMSIDKGTGEYRGYFGMVNTGLSCAGYKHNVGAITHDGDEINFGILFSGSGIQYLEGRTSDYGTTLSAQQTVTQINSMNSIGRSPTGLYTFSSINNIIGGNLKFGVLNTVTFKVVSDPLEGVLACSSTASPNNPGTITIYNNTYYLHLGSILDNTSYSHKLLLELGT